MIGDNVRDQPCLPELAGSLDQGIDAGEQLGVLAVLEVLEESVREPGAAGRVPLPAGATVDVGGDADRPTTDLARGVPEAIARVVEESLGGVGPGRQLGQAIVGEGIEAARRDRPSSSSSGY